MGKMQKIQRNVSNFFYEYSKMIFTWTVMFNSPDLSVDIAYFYWKLEKGSFKEQFISITVLSEIFSSLLAIAMSISKIE